MLTTTKFARVTDVRTPVDNDNRQFFFSLEVVINCENMCKIETMKLIFLEGHGIVVISVQIKLEELRLGNAFVYTFEHSQTNSLVVLLLASC